MTSDDRDGATRIRDERERQKFELGWTPQHDVDEHDGGQLASAAACYAALEPIYVEHRHAAGVEFTDPFPNNWSDARLDDHGEALDINTDTKRGRANAIRLLEKAGALCAAEIDRLLAVKGRQ